MSSYFSDSPALYNLNKLRQSIRANRRALTAKQQLANSQSITKTLRRTALFRNSSRIALYLENDGEIAVSQLSQIIRDSNKRCYLPVLRSLAPNRLWFAEYKVGDRLCRNRYGILEPDLRKHKPIRPYTLDLVVVPLVAFDSECNRVGMGGGFYDRTFSYLNNRNAWRKPKLIGVAHELQKHDSLQQREWDVSLDGVVTESNIYAREH